MTISEKITINHKIQQSKAQYDLHRQTAKISNYPQEMLLIPKFWQAKMF